MTTAANDPWTIRRIVRWSAEDFAKRGIDSPRLDAELIVAHALGVDRVRLYMDLERELSADELVAIRALVTRRRKREPIAYLLGTKEFWGRRFAVSAAVLIPRPDTETLVERALAIAGTSQIAVGVDVELVQREPVVGVETHVEELLPEPEPVVESEGGEPTQTAASAAVEPSAPEAPRSIAILDLCTGSGAIGLTLACELGGARVTITDVSAAALEIARANLATFAVSDATLVERVAVLEGDLFAPLAVDARFDLVVCNPPYLAARELGECEPDVKDHEPSIALVSGPLGDETLIRVVEGARAVLAPGGTLLVEMGSTQGARVRELFERAGYRDVRVHRDLGDRDRVVEGRRRSMFRRA